MRPSLDNTSQQPATIAASQIIKKGNVCGDKTTDENINVDKDKTSDISDYLSYNSKDVNEKDYDIQIDIDSQNLSQ